MPKMVVDTANLKCSEGSSPSSLKVTSHATVCSESKLVATVQDFKPNANIMPFGMCRSMSNPQVQSATAAANGTLTPQPCVPVIAAPWSPGASTVNVCGAKALADSSTCQCQWLGKITIEKAGQDSTNVGDQASAGSTKSKSTQSKQDQDKPKLSGVRLASSNLSFVPSMSMGAAPASSEMAPKTPTDAPPSAGTFVVYGKPPPMDHGWMLNNDNRDSYEKALVAFLRRKEVEGPFRCVSIEHRGDELKVAADTAPYYRVFVYFGHGNPHELRPFREPGGGLNPEQFVKLVLSKNTSRQPMTIYIHGCRTEPEFGMAVDKLLFNVQASVHGHRTRVQVSIAHESTPPYRVNDNGFDQEELEEKK